MAGAGATSDLGGAGAGLTTMLVTGIESDLGARTAALLGAAGGVRLIGMPSPGATVAVSAAAGIDLQTPALDGYGLADLLRCQGVAVVVHLAIAGEERPAPDRETMLQQNVLRSSRLLGACAAAGVQRVVVRSSTLVYGAQLSNPAFIRETCQPARRLAGLPGSYGELDRLVGEFARSHPALAVIRLRLANVLGGGVCSPLARYLAQARPPLLAGFNPRVQLVHPADAAAACARAALADLVANRAPTQADAGIYNVAAAAPLTLLQIIRLVGKQPLVVPPVPPLPLVVRVAALAGWTCPSLRHLWPSGAAFLRYACVADTRRVAAELGWQPAWCARMLVEEVAGAST